MRYGVWSIVWFVVAIFVLIIVLRALGAAI